MRKCKPFRSFLTHPYWFPHLWFFFSSSSFSSSLQHAAAASSLLWSSVEILSLYSTRGAVGLIAHAVESAGAVGEVEVVLLHPFPLPRLVWKVSLASSLPSLRRGEICPAVPTQLRNHRRTHFFSYLTFLFFFFFLKGCFVFGSSGWIRSCSSSVVEHYWGQEEAGVEKMTWWMQIKVTARVRQCCQMRLFLYEERDVPPHELWNNSWGGKSIQFNSIQVPLYNLKVAICKNFCQQLEAAFPQSNCNLVHQCSWH